MRSATPRSALRAGLFLALLPALLPAQETLLCGFEGPEALRGWEIVSGTAALVAEGATEGRQALELCFDPKARYNGAYLSWRRVPRDWSAHDALALDVTNPGPGPVPASLLIADQAWADRGRTYWNRHNAHTAFPPGRSRWVIPVRGLFRGEAGCRNPDLKTDIDPAGIVRLDFGFGVRGAGGRILLDNLRLLRLGRPAGVWAFDLGPPGQVLQPGWTPVSQETVYTPERGHGWGPRGGRPWNGAARDTTFGGPLLQDFCEAGGYSLRIDVPPGRYRAAVFFENSGYWGGEQAAHTERRILADGAVRWRETRPDGAAHPLYRFERTEPVGVDLWQTYMAAELARPAEFDCDAAPDGLVLTFEADRTWGAKVSALALHRSDDAAAARWLAAELEGVAAEFRRRAVCLDPAGAPVLPPAWKEAPLAAWPVELEDEIQPAAGPPAGAPGPSELALARLALRGERELFCLCLRPRENLGACTLRLAPLAGPGALDARILVAWYGLRRGFGDVSHRVRPHTLRPQERVDLEAGVTRMLAIAVQVPEEARPGDYRGALEVLDSGGTVLLRVPLHLAVTSALLRREADFSVGFFGLMPPAALGAERRWALLAETLALLRERGFNAVSGGPDFKLSGWRDGEPVIDFGDMDRFFALLASHGFRRPLNGYGGARFLGLHDGYTKGAAAARVEKQSALP